MHCCRTNWNWLLRPVFCRNPWLTARLANGCGNGCLNCGMNGKTRLIRRASYSGAFTAPMNKRSSTIRKGRPSEKAWPVRQASNKCPLRKMDLGFCVFAEAAVLFCFRGGRLCSGFAECSMMLWLIAVVCQHSVSDLYHSNIYIWLYSIYYRSFKLAVFKKWRRLSKQDSPDHRFES